MWKVWSNFQRYAYPVRKWAKQGTPLLLLVGLVFLLVAIWWLGPRWTIVEREPLASLAMRILATVVLLILPLLVWALSLRSRNRRLEAERAQEISRQEDPCLVYVQAQERALDRSLAILQTSLEGRNKLYQLPWYLVLGQEKSGKTSFVNRSSQSFTLTGEVKAGSRGLLDDPDLVYAIDWWMGDQAVLIDPPGELISHVREAGISHEGEQTEPAIAAKTGKVTTAFAASGRELPENLHTRLWDSLVGWLGRNRSRRPLNGVVLMVDVVTLLNQQPSDRKALAILLRTRLIELSQQLGTRPPLYVVLSKFDLMDGFEAMFARMQRSMREDIFGFTFTLDSVQNYDAWLAELEERYDGFIARLNDQIFDSLSEPVELRQREALYSLARQLSGMRPVLLGFLADIMASDRYATPALPRGVYFSSVHQQGLLNNTFINSASNAYGVGELTSSAHPSGRSTVYFAQQLFQRVIYPESGLAGDNLKVLANKRRALALSFGVASLGCVVTIGTWYHYYGINRDKAAMVLERSRAYSTYAIDREADPTGRNLLQPLDQIRSAVAVYEDYRHAWPVLADFGLYQGRKIGPKVDEAYLALLSQRFLPALAGGLMTKMTAPETPDDTKLAALRVYRMIEDRANRRPPIVEDWMGKQWQAAFSGQDGVQRALMSHLDYAMRFADTRLPQYKNQLSVVQRDLRLVPMPQRVYMTMRHQAGETLGTPLDLRNEIGPAFDIVYLPEAASAADNARAGASARIDALLTAKGYTNYFAPHSKDVTELAMIDQWALGERSNIDYSEADKQALADRIRAIYSRDYIDSWQRGINQLDVRDFADLNQAVGVLGAVTSPAAPLRRLVETVRDNSGFGGEQRGAVNLSTADGVATAEAKEVLSQKPVPTSIADITHAFAPLTQLLLAKGDRPAYLDETMLSIGAVYETVKRVQDSPNQSKAALTVVLDRFAMKGPDPFGNLQRVAAGLPEPLNHQVSKLANEAAQVVLIEALGEVERRWDADIYRFYYERLAQRYPFNPASMQDASLDDFTAFFGPQGRLQQFREQYLKPFLDDNLEMLYSERRGGYLIKTDVLTQLEAADRISDAFFNARGALGVQFVVEPLGLTPTRRSSSLSIEGQLITYSHGPTLSTNLIWPNTLAESNESRLTLINGVGNSSSLVFRGSWSMFRLLSQARLNGATASSVDLSFLASDGGMRYRITAEKANNPFMQPLFKGFVLPRTLLSARPEHATVAAK
ncbi:type VI secretion system membrane subunit TssM [Burkholderia sp. Bp8963]|uniref:type VI secretion system membrane subunit TssM n=1 Tax=Burkholderia sp. Bp8963 TaxID=2184547 RepID=UPI000F5B1A37|nr:type VI secretion system membrane subunit TssM [Burkholderia sp. Bp8963]RQS75480.1 type VI secretion system membrane subunit TssM [Burkholderia sp. Bp8963]